MPNGCASFWIPARVIDPERMIRLLRELERTSEVNPSAEGQVFARQAKRLIQDPLRPRARGDITPKIFRTLQRRSYQAIDTLVECLYIILWDGPRPFFPAKSSADE
ncbi:MAG: hypothetical protein ACE15F_13590 [bacterium]